MVKILSLQQIKEVELATMQSDNICSWQLMERAATAICRSFVSLYSPRKVFICVGKGGNGGDGLAVGRMLSLLGYDVSILTLFDSKICSNDYQKNLSLIPDNVCVTNDIDYLFSKIDDGCVFIDAIFGVGYQAREFNEKVARVISLINSRDRDICPVVSIDVPSGMESSLDASVKEDSCVRSDKTLTIYSPKLSMLLPTSGEYVGDIILVNIGYCISAIEQAKSNYHYIYSIKESKRPKFSHKGTYGSLLIVGAGKGMFGASIIAAKGAEIAGCGVIRVVSPRQYLSALYSNIPSAMAHIVDEEYFCRVPDNLKSYDVVCVGMGMGQDSKTVEGFKELLKKCASCGVSMVIDADGLNIAAQSYEIMRLIPPNSILTPHPGEFKRLVGEYYTESEKISKLLELANQTKSVVVLKGAHSVVATPSGELFFNSTGCSALSRAGAGDLLSGIVAAHLSESKDAVKAAIQGVFSHGLAADKSAEKFGARQSTISRIIESY